VRLRPRLEAVGQDAEALLAAMDHRDPASPGPPPPWPSAVPFLASPTRVLTDAVDGSAVWKSKKYPRARNGGHRGARHGHVRTNSPGDGGLAIGDRVDEQHRVTLRDGDFSPVRRLTRARTDGAAYQVYDPVHHKCWSTPIGGLVNASQ